MINTPSLKSSVKICKHLPKQLCILYTMISWLQYCLAFHPESEKALQIFDNKTVSSLLKYLKFVRSKPRK